MTIARSALQISLLSLAIAFNVVEIKSAMLETYLPIDMFLGKISRKCSQNVQNTGLIALSNSDPDTRFLSGKSEVVYNTISGHL